jgi:hypothetical protein
MMINMAVAIIAVKMKSAVGINDFIELDEPLYVPSLFSLLVFGPGWVSVDHLIWKNSPALALGRHPHLERTETSVVGRSEIRGWSPTISAPESDNDGCAV